jgi:hypothetical protein
MEKKNCKKRRQKRKPESSKKTKARSGIISIVNIISTYVLVSGKRNCTVIFFWGGGYGIQTKIRPLQARLQK